MTSIALARATSEERHKRLDDKKIRSSVVLARETSEEGRRRLDDQNTSWLVLNIMMTSQGCVAPPPLLRGLTSLVY